MASSAAQDTSSEAPQPTTSALAHSEEDVLDTVEDEHSVDENTPFLASGDEEQGGTQAPTRPKAIYILTILSLSFSMATLVLSGICGIFSAQGQRPWWGYTIDEAFHVAVVGTILATLISAFNVSRLRKFRYPAPTFINIVLDFGIGWSMILNCVGGLSQVIEDGYEIPLTWKILIGTILGTAIVVGIDHFILFLLRMRMFLESEAWQGPWSFPPGQVTFEFTVKVLKQTQNMATPQRTQAEQ